jgi:hypothetical protein
MWLFVPKSTLFIIIPCGEAKANKYGDDTLLAIDNY